MSRNKKQTGSGDITIALQAIEPIIVKKKSAISTGWLSLLLKRISVQSGDKINEGYNNGSACFSPNLNGPPHTYLHYVDPFEIILFI